MMLSFNFQIIQMQVEAQTVSGNIDEPEGGFDGLLQTIVCTRLIGWRDLSRKLLLYISDERFHIANDGKVYRFLSLFW